MLDNIYRCETCANCINYYENIMTRQLFPIRVLT